MAREDDIIATLQNASEFILGMFTDTLVSRNWVTTIGKPIQESLSRFYAAMVDCFEKEQNKSPHEIGEKPTQAIFLSVLTIINSDPESMRIFLRQHKIIGKYIFENEQFLKEMAQIYNDYLEYVDKDTASVIANLQAAQDMLLRGMVDDPIFRQWAESFDEESQTLFHEFTQDMFTFFEKSTNIEIAQASKLGKNTVNFRVYPAHKTFELALRNINSEPNFIRNFLRLNVDIKEYLALNSDFLEELSVSFNDYLKGLNNDTPMQDTIEPGEGSKDSVNPEMIEAVIQKLGEHKELMYDLKHRFQKTRMFTEEKSAIAQYDDLWLSSDLCKWSNHKINKRKTIYDFQNHLLEAILKDSDPDLHQTKAYLPFTNALSRYIAYNLSTGAVQLESSNTLKEYLANHPHVADYLLANLDNLRKCTAAFKHHLDKKQAKKQSVKSEAMHIDSTTKENVHTHKKDIDKDHEMLEDEHSGPSTKRPR